MSKSPLIHHVSVINEDVEESFTFYNKVLGLDLLMKTVNQDDLEMYHLFFSDTKGRTGTKFTVFPMQGGKKKEFGTNDIERTVFAVPTEDSLYFWEKRLNEQGSFNCEIEEYDGSKILRFEDEAGVNLGLVPLKDESAGVYSRETEDISRENAIIGIDSIHLRVRYPEASATILKELFGLSVTRTIQDGIFKVTVMEKEETLFNQAVHLIEDKMNPLAVEGIGSTHHIALSVKNLSALEEVEDYVLERNFANSGIKNREFFHSLYFREPNKLLIEIATNEGSFSKKSYKNLAFKDIPLDLPNFLENKRPKIERNLGL